MDSTDVLADVEMTDDELAGVYGGFRSEMSVEPCEYEMMAGEDHIFM